jgi:hypothetical protein
VDNSPVFAIEKHHVLNNSIEVCPPEPNPSDKSLPVGAIVGIALGIPAVLLGGAGAICFVRRDRRAVSEKLMSLDEQSSELLVKSDAWYT